MKFTEWLIMTVIFITMMVTLCYIIHGNHMNSYNYILWITSGWVEGSFVTWYVIKSSNKKE